MSTDVEYRDLLAAGRACYPGMRIGRPGRARGYWPLWVLAQVLRVRLDIRQDGHQVVPRGGAILVGNHSSWADPVVATLPRRWRVTAFTKVEAFDAAGAFFRAAGQVPLRRGDEAATRWSMAMVAWILAHGGKVLIYPEGTRAPHPGRLHRLHRRILVPLIQDNPGIPVYAVTASYERRGWRRTRADVRFAGPLPVHDQGLSADAITAVVRDALVELGGLDYVDITAQAAKRRPQPTT